jgi:ribose 5-phosphate isomerase A
MKEKVGKYLASLIKDGDVFGIGSGTTVQATLQAIGERVKQEGISVSGIPTSHGSALMAEEMGINLIAPVSRTKLAWAFDGADQVDPQLNLLKGLGAAMLNEKIICKRAERFMVLVTEDKLVKELGGNCPVPVETLPEALVLVEQALTKLGASEVSIRHAKTDFGKTTPVMTEHGNFILDAVFKTAPAELEGQIKSITGVVESGIFTKCNPEILIAKADGIWSKRFENGQVKESKVA